MTRTRAFAAAGLLFAGLLMGQAATPRSLIPGDINLDGKITGDDAPAFEAMRADVRGYLAQHQLSEADLLRLVDLNQDGRYDRADLDLFRQLIAKAQDAAPSPAQPPQPGDLNGDGQITSADYELLTEALDHEGAFLARLGWTRRQLVTAADFNKDGRLDRVDQEAMKRSLAARGAAMPMPPVNPPVAPVAAEPAAPAAPVVRPLAPAGDATGKAQPLEATSGARVPPLTTPTAPAGRAVQPAFDLGMNLSPLNYYSSQWAFTDMMKQSSIWLTQKSDSISPFNTSEPYDKTPDGWPIPKPGQAIAALMLRDVDGKYPIGKWVATYDGKGRLGFYFAASLVKHEDGRAIADVRPGSDGILLRIEESDPKNPVRNIRFVPNELEHYQGLFHPVFLDRLRPFKVLRFMPWQNTNESEIEKWADRTTPDHISQDRGPGVALEYMIELCNTLNIDPWFCIPHRADDDFVRNFAVMVNHRLNKNRKVYVEYSNEVWNWGFKQGTWMQQKGVERGLGKQYEARLRFQSERSVEIFQIFEKAFGGRDRLVRVIGSQAAQSWIANDLLAWKDTYKHVDALAIAPYFGHDIVGRIAARPESITNDELVGLSWDSIVPQTADTTTLNAKVARRYNVQLIAYEGGQHIAAGGGQENNQKVVAVVKRINRDPRMYDLYSRMLQAWRNSGGGMFVAFDNVETPNKWGSWGHLEWQGQPVDEAHKFRALIQGAAGVLPVPERPR